MSHGHDDLEPIEGLPELPPPGEEILWQGRPQWRSLLRRAFKMRLVAAYFGVLLGAQVVSNAVKGQLWIGLGDTLSTFAIFATCLGLLTLLAWLHGRATVYTITNRRVVMRIGVALPITWNLPLSRIASADLVVGGDDDGDVVLHLVETDRVRWFHFWPHARRGRRLRASPTLRAVARPAHVAATLAGAARTCGAVTTIPAEWAGVTTAPPIPAT